ncbi:MAG TPA: hypothetical protein VNF99_02760 [Stellaceae bacterium]|nr:hypothetical protein [Stellaceae bacterium]
MTKPAQKSDKRTRPQDKVVVDNSPPAGENSEPLDSLDLDERLLASAASDGMSGGELNKLREVLQAKDHVAIAAKTGKA